MSNLELDSFSKPGTTAISDVMELFVDIKTAIPLRGFMEDLLTRSACGSSCQSILISVFFFSERKEMQLHVQQNKVRKINSACTKILF